MHHTVARYLACHAVHVTKETLREQMNIIEVLLPAPITLMGLGLVSANKNPIAKWTSFFSFWLFMFSWATARWMRVRMRRIITDHESLELGVELKDGMLWFYLLGVVGMRFLALLCLAIASCAMVMMG
ncbi:hypothetical protein FRC03_003158 [Tulasnella sp. 419]|nr:hypothetical protein FRC03_003158 [Tulasnella sp. 419]